MKKAWALNTRTVVIITESEEKTEDFAQTLEASIADELARSEKLKVLSSKMIEDLLKKQGLQSCKDKTKECIQKMREILHVELVLNVKLTQKEYNAGKKVISPYLTQIIKGKYYEVSVEVIDITKNVTREKYKERDGSKEKLKEKMRQVAIKIIKHYDKDKPQPLITSKPVKSKETTLFSTSRLALWGSVLKPVGSYADIAKSGYGGGAGLYGNLKSYSSVMLGISFEYYILDPAISSIQTIRQYSASLNIAYSILSKPIIRLSPYIGGGYIVCEINGNKNSAISETSKNYYYDPSISAGLDISLPITDKLSLMVVPANTIFFEKNNQGYFVTVKAGLGYTW